MRQRLPYPILTPSGLALMHDHQQSQLYLVAQVWCRACFPKCCGWWDDEPAHQLWPQGQLSHQPQVVRVGEQKDISPLFTTPYSRWQALLLICQVAWTRLIWPPVPSPLTVYSTLPIVLLCLLVRVQVNLLWGCESKRTDPAPLVCHVVVRERERCPPPLFLPPVANERADPAPHQIQNEGEWPWTSPGQLSRADPVDGGIGELAEEHECEILSPAPQLPYGVVGKTEKPPSPTFPLRPVVVGEPSLRSLKQEIWPCLSPAVALGRMAPTPQVGNTVDLALVV